MDEQSEGEDIGPLVDVFPLQLLRRHISWRPDCEPLAGQRAWPARAGGLVGLAPCNAEIQQLCSLLREQDVGRLEVPVHDSMLVSFLQGLGDLPRILQRLFQRQRP